MPDPVTALVVGGTQVVGGMMQSRAASKAAGAQTAAAEAGIEEQRRQFDAVQETATHLADMIAAGWDIVVTHGNGPQVGFILRRSELAMHELHPVPLDYCGADTQGAIGYMLQKAMRNEFKKRGIQKKAVTVVTQVEVSADDPAFQNPSKPIGSFMEEETARDRKVNIQSSPPHHGKSSAKPVR